jgi:hypothetical protein
MCVWECWMCHSYGAIPHQLRHYQYRFIPWTISPGVKWPGREAEHSPPSSAEVRNVWSFWSGALS